MKTPTTGQINHRPNSIASSYLSLLRSVNPRLRSLSLYLVYFTGFHTSLYGCNPLPFRPPSSTPKCQSTNLLDRGGGNLNYYFYYVATLFPPSSLALFIQIYSDRAPFHWTTPRYRTLLSSLHVVLRFPRNTGCVRTPRVWLAIPILAANILRLRFAS